jgi:hypothetical protein
MKEREREMTMTGGIHQEGGDNDTLDEEGEGHQHPAPLCILLAICL